MLWNQICMGIIGLSGGFIVASGLVSFLISLRIIPRYAGVTHTADRILLYEDMLMAGTVFGNCLFLYKWQIPVGSVGLAIYGGLSGIFLGSWVIALAEITNIFPIMSRRIGIIKGTGLIVLSIALGKIAGAWYFFSKGW